MKHNANNCLSIPQLFRDLLLDFFRIALRPDSIICFVIKNEFFKIVLILALIRFRIWVWVGVV